MTKRYSTSYVFTADVTNDDDMKFIENLRKEISEYNKLVDFVHKRVVLRGRKPKSREIITNYWTGKSGYRSYDWAGNIVGGIKNSTMIDVYVYNR